MTKAGILIVVDMQNDFCREGGALFFPQSLTIIDAIQEKIKEYRLERKPIIFTRDLHSHDDYEFTKFPPHCVHGTDGADIIDELQPLQHTDEKVINKTRYSAFHGTRLGEILDNEHAVQLGVEVCGVCTNICVMDTVGGLSNEDVEVFVDVQCVADFDDDAHEFALNRMEKIYGAKIYNKYELD